jgi:hypothetical protein
MVSVFVPSAAFQQRPSAFLKILATARDAVRDGASYLRQDLSNIPERGTFPSGAKVSGRTELTSKRDHPKG